jgi:predicted amino acid racemase
MTAPRLTIDLDKIHHNAHTLVQRLDECGIPVTDALTRSPDRLVEMVRSAFPELEREFAVGAR